MVNSLRLKTCGNRFLTSLLTSIAPLPSPSIGSLRASQNRLKLLNYFSLPALEFYSGYQVVKILDNGQGITEEELPHLFERFYQGHSDRHASGSGLGLYLTRQIIEAHGGTIWAENRSPRGALFGFRLPASVPQPLLSH